MCSSCLAIGALPVRVEEAGQSQGNGRGGSSILPSTHSFGIPLIKSQNNKLHEKKNQNVHFMAINKLRVQNALKQTNMEMFL